MILPYRSKPTNPDYAGNSGRRSRRSPTQAHILWRKIKTVSKPRGSYTDTHSQAGWINGKRWQPYLWYTKQLLQTKYLPTTNDTTFPTTTPSKRRISMKGYGNIGILKIMRTDPRICVSTRIKIKLLFIIMRLTEPFSIPWHLIILHTDTEGTNPKKLK